MNRIDFVIAEYQGIWTVGPTHDEARDWLTSHAHATAFWCGDMLCVESSCLTRVVRDILDAGFTIFRSGGKR